MHLQKLAPATKDKRLKFVREFSKAAKDHKRSSFETELLGQFPTHVVPIWFGPSVTVMLKHYVQVTSERFDRAGGPKKAAHFLCSKGLHQVYDCLQIRL
ncbi:MAG: hypothetical protein EBQ87_15795 [Planctomycetes bacterium]|nr:hypothetical protein [Planctomycetota bacterium]